MKAATGAIISATARKTCFMKGFPQILATKEGVTPVSGLVADRLREFDYLRITAGSDVAPLAGRDLIKFESSFSSIVGVEMQIRNLKPVV